MAEERGECNRESEAFRKVLSGAGRPAAPGGFPRMDTHWPCAGSTIGRKRHGGKWTWKRPMPKTEAELFAFLADLGITVSTTRHPPLHTVADSQALRGEIPGAHTKNLFLKDKKDNFFLVTVGEEATVDLKQIHQLIGAASRVSFGRPEMLMELLGVSPGAVTVFGVINDTAGRVKLVLDEELMRHEVINGHPPTNEATTSIASRDLLRFVEATGHDAAILKVTA
jgi:Ala-tRNA(Pro) deacylase